MLVLEARGRSGAPTERVARARDKPGVMVAMVREREVDERRKSRRSIVDVLRCFVKARPRRKMRGKEGR